MSEIIVLHLHNDIAAASGCFITQTEQT